MIQTKTTEKERMMNTKVLNALIYALVDNHIDGVASLLSDDGWFFSRSKLAFLAMLNTLFMPLRGKGYEVVVNSAVSLHPFPGAECVEIRLLPSEDNDEYRPLQKINFGSGKREETEVIFRFVAEFKKGKIWKLNKPVFFIPEQSIRSDRELNWN